MHIGLLVELADDLTGLGASQRALIDGLALANSRYRISIVRGPLETPGSSTALRDNVSPLDAGRQLLDSEHSFLSSNVVKDFDLLHGLRFYVPTEGSAKKVVTVHDTMMIRDVDKVSFAGVLAASNRASVAAADHIIAVSRYTKSCVLRDLNVSEDRVSVVYNGVDLERFHPSTDEPKAQILRDELTNYILYVGGYRARKNVGVLLRAFDHFSKSTRGHYRLVMVNGFRKFFDPDISSVALSGTKDHGLEEKLAVHLKHYADRDGIDVDGDKVRVGKIVIVGSQSEDNLIDLYRHATLTCYPTLEEGFGLPALEAMACGTPVVASNTSSIPEVVGDSGILVNPLNYGEISHAIQMLVTDSVVRSRLIQNGIERAANFGIRQMAERTLEIYDSLL